LGVPCPAVSAYITLLSWRLKCSFVSSTVNTPTLSPLLPLISGFEIRPQHTPSNTETESTPTLMTWLNNVSGLAQNVSRSAHGQVQQLLPILEEFPILIPWITAPSVEVHTTLLIAVFTVVALKAINRLVRAASSSYGVPNGPWGFPILGKASER